MTLRSFANHSHLYALAQADAPARRLWSHVLYCPAY